MRCLRTRGCLIAIANQSEQLRPLNYRNLFLTGRSDDGDRSALLFLNSRPYLSKVSIEINEMVERVKGEF